jgi:hypothetical protein
VRKGWWGKGQVVDPGTGELVEATLGTPRRLKTIYMANLRTAHAAASGAHPEGQACLALPPVYVTPTTSGCATSTASGTTSSCRSNDPWWRTHYPPNGWGCRCHVIQLSQRQVERLGAHDLEPPPERTREWRNRRTGAVQHVPIGIDPGWASNPGAVRGADLGRTLGDKGERLASASEPMAHAAVEDVLGGPGFARLLAGRPDAIPAPVAVLPEALGQALGTGRRAVVLSPDVAGKQLRRHPNMAASAYASVQAMIDEGGAWIERGSRLVLQKTIAGRLWQAVVKRAKDGQLHLVSLHRADARNVRRVRRRGEAVR